MPKYVRIVAHRSRDDLAYRYRKATDPIEGSHASRSSGGFLGENASEKWQRALVTPANWIRILARRYNQDGLHALADQRQHHKGASPLLVFGTTGEMATRP